jgi:hypothetical protein
LLATGNKSFFGPSGRYNVCELSCVTLIGTRLAITSH